MAYGDFTRDEIVRSVNPLLPVMQDLPPSGNISAFEGYGQLPVETKKSGIMAWISENKVLTLTLVFMFLALVYYFYRERKLKKNSSIGKFDFVEDEEIKPLKKRKKRDENN